MFRTVAVALLAAACASAAAQQPAPIAWETPLGRLTYALEDGPYGVFEYPVAFGDNVGFFYFDGLAGEFGRRGPLDGYWSEPDVSHDDDDEDDTTLICPFPIVDGHGRTTRNWGRVKIVFMQDDFPGDFMILRGRCFEDPNEPLPGKLIT